MGSDIGRVVSRRWIQTGRVVVVGIVRGKVEPSYHHAIRNSFLVFPNEHNILRLLTTFGITTSGGTDLVPNTVIKPVRTLRLIIPDGDRLMELKEKGFSFAP